MTDDITMNFENLQLDSEINERKLFVGGLSWITTEDGLRQYFEGLGLHVDTVTIMRDKRGRSRGFGFLTLASPKEIEMAISFHLHIDGRKVEAKRAIPQSDMSNHAKKIFVGGLPVSLTNYDFRKYFESFGKVLESQIMTDRDSGRSRGFGFITFEEEKTASEVLLSTHTISGKPVEVKQAEPKSPQVQTYPLTPLYIPNFAYSPVFNPITNDQATHYFTQPQSNLIYIPPVYDPGMMNSMDKNNNNIRVNPESKKRTQTAPVIPTHNVAPLTVRPAVYEQPEKSYTNTHTVSSQDNAIPFKGLELRTERAFSEPWTERADKSNEVPNTKLGRLSPPIKRRQGTISIQSSSQPPVDLRRNENWGRNIATPSSQPLHKYFQ
jgi:RNA recognition motif-containing protein